MPEIDPAVVSDSTPAAEPAPVAVESAPVAVDPAPAADPVAGSDTAAEPAHDPNLLAELARDIQIAEGILATAKAAVPPALQKSIEASSFVQSLIAKAKAEGEKIAAEAHQLHELALARVEEAGKMLETLRSKLNSYISSPK